MSHIISSLGVKPNKCIRVVAIDTETAKNWRSAEKFIPFCANFFSIFINPEEDFSFEKIKFETEIYFRGEKEDIQSYLLKIDEIACRHLKDAESVETVFVGHQLSSDLSSLRSLSKKNLESIEKLIYGLKNRKSGAFPKVADTRYDINGRVVGDEKLRNVSLRMGIVAVQTELDEKSLTKLYNEYVIDGVLDKKEKLIVMNLRHAFQTALVWIIDSFYGTKKLWNADLALPIITTNEIISHLVGGDLGYINSPNYRSTIEREGVIRYIKNNAGLCQIYKGII